MNSHNSITRSILVGLISVFGVTLMILMFNSSAAARSLDADSNSISLMQLLPSNSNAVQSVSTLTDTTVANFQAGSGDCYAAPSAGNDFDGELILSPTLGITFTGTTLPSGWYSGTYTANGAVTVSNGLLTAAGAFAGTSAAYPPSRTLEFSATFGVAAAGEHIGLASSTDLNTGPWAIFSTGSSGDQLYARTLNEVAPPVDTPLGPAYLGIGHRYRIEWTDTSIIYLIDGSAVVTNTTAPITVTMRPLVSSGNFTNSLAVDWLRMGSYATACSFQSRVLDAGQAAHWLDANLDSQQPPNTAIGGLQTRSGSVNPPNGTWSAWAPVSGTTIASPNGRYIQYQVQLTSTDGMNTPALEDITLSFTPSGQTITFNPLPNKTYGDPAFTVVATATSGLPVTFTVSGGACSIAVAMVSLTAAGSCSVTAHQAGNTTFDPAPNVTQTFTVAKANATISVTAYSVTYDANAHTATGTAKGVNNVTLSGLNLNGTTHTNAGDYPSDAWTFTDVTGNYNNANGTVQDSIAKANATISVTAYSVTYDGNAHTATGTAKGVNNVTLSGLNLNGTTHTNAGDYPSDAWTFTDVTGNYNNANGTVHDSIALATQTITFNPLPDKIIGDLPFTVVATATSGLSVTFSASGDCSIAGNTVTLIKAGSCTVTAHQTGDANYQPATDVPQTFAIQGIKVFLAVIIKNSP